MVNRHEPSRDGTLRYVNSWSLSGTLKKLGPLRKSRVHRATGDRCSVWHATRDAIWLELRTVPGCPKHWNGSSRSERGGPGPRKAMGMGVMGGVPCPPNPWCVAKGHVEAGPMLGSAGIREPPGQPMFSQLSSHMNMAESPIVGDI